MAYTFVESGLDEVLAYIDEHHTLGLDIESTGLSPFADRILLLQIGTPEQQFVIDVAKVDVSPLNPYFASNKWKKILFNGKFDLGMLEYNYGSKFRNIFDCFIAERVITPESQFGNSFEELALKYLGVVLNKNIRKTFYGKKGKTFTEDQIKYSAEDVEHMFGVMDKQVAELTRLKMLHIADLEFDLVPAVAKMELVGVAVDKAKWRETMKEFEADWEESRKATLSMFTGQAVEDFDQQLGLFGDGLAMPKSKLNLNSPLQLKEALAQHGIIVEKTDDQHLSKHSDKPLVKSLLEYKKLQKLVSSYGPVPERAHPFTGKIHANWKQIGTETGRFSCKEPNLQQVPAKLRESIGGEKGWVLVGGDFSQAELRILAQESGDPILVDAFKNGKDIHSVTATEMFGINMEDVTKEQRYTAKTLNFGITYGMQVKKFVDMMNGEAIKEGRATITIAEGKALLEKYKETYKTASRYLESVGLKSLRDGRTQTRFGRIRFFSPVPNTLDPDRYRAMTAGIKRQGANMPIQGTCADIMKMAMVNIYNDLQDYGYLADIILQVHDEIVIRTHPSQVEPVRSLLVQYMEEAGRLLVPDIPVVVDSYVSDYWKK